MKLLSWVKKKKEDIGVVTCALEARETQWVLRSLGWACTQRVGGVEGACVWVDVYAGWGEGG